MLTSEATEMRVALWRRSVQDFRVNGASMKDQKSPHTRLQYSLPARASFPFAGKGNLQPLYQVPWWQCWETWFSTCFCNIAVQCWCLSASRTPQWSGRNSTPCCNTLLFFVSNVVWVLLVGSGFVCCWGFFVWFFVCLVLFVGFWFFGVFFSQSLVAWQLKGLCYTLKCACASTEENHTVKQGEGPCQRYREDSTTGWVALLGVTVTSRMESNTSTRLLLDISCAWSSMGIQEILSVSTQSSALLLSGC